MILTLFFCSLLAVDTTTQGLSQLVALNQVSVSAESKGGLHNKNFLIRIKNLSKKRQKIKVESGTQFIASESQYQNLLVIDEQIVELLSGESIDLNHYAKCTEKFDFGPQELLKYKYGGMATEPLPQLAQLLHQGKFYDSFAQMCIWSVSDNVPLQDYSLSKEKVDIGNKIYELLKKNNPNGAKIISDTKKTPQIFSFVGKAIYHNPIPQKVSLFIVKHNGDTLYRYYKNKSIPSGLREIQYGINDIFADSLFYYELKMTDVNGKTLYSQKVEKNTLPTQYEPVTLKKQIRFLLQESQKLVKINMYTNDGELVEEIHTYKDKSPGNYGIWVEFMHIYPSNTHFTIKVETPDKIILEEDFY